MVMRMMGTVDRAGPPIGWTAKAKGKAVIKFRGKF